MRVAIAFDHRGVSLRASATSELVAHGDEVLDLGADARIPTVDDVEALDLRSLYPLEVPA